MKHNEKLRLIWSQTFNKYVNKMFSDFYDCEKFKVNILVKLVEFNRTFMFPQILQKKKRLFISHWL